MRRLKSVFCRDAQLDQHLKEQKATCLQQIAIIKELSCRLENLEDDNLGLQRNITLLTAEVRTGVFQIRNVLKRAVSGWKP